MDDFAPINRDHAVQAASFSLAFDRPIPSAVSQQLRSRPELLTDLPAVQTPEGFELMMAGPTPVPRRIGGIQLSHLRPDGTPAWALRMVGNELAVDCTRYTRWGNVWSTALRYLRTGLEVLERQQTERRVSVIGHNVVDAFTANRDNYNLSSLLERSALLAACVFESGDTWHSHVGWFEESGDAGVAWLNQLNVDALRPPTLPSQQSPSLRVHVTHNQELRFATPVSIAEAKAQLDDRMSDLHAKNKFVLKQLLVFEMAKRIGLLEEKHERAIS